MLIPFARKAEDRVDAKTKLHAAEAVGPRTHTFVLSEALSLRDRGES